jgi:hypothetical protein
VVGLIDGLDRHDRYQALSTAADQNSYRQGPIDRNRARMWRGLGAAPCELWPYLLRPCKARARVFGTMHGCLKNQGFPHLHRPLESSHVPPKFSSKVYHHPPCKWHALGMLARNAQSPASRFQHAQSGTCRRLSHHRHAGTLACDTAPNTPAPLKKRRCLPYQMPRRATQHVCFPGTHGSSSSASPPSTSLKNVVRPDFGARPALPARGERGLEVPAPPSATLASSTSLLSA